MTTIPSRFYAKSRVYRTNTIWVATADPVYGESQSFCVVNLGYLKCAVSSDTKQIHAQITNLPVGRHRVNNSCRLEGDDSGLQLIKGRVLETFSTDKADLRNVCEPLRIFDLEIEGDTVTLDNNGNVTYGDGGIMSFDLQRLKSLLLVEHEYMTVDRLYGCRIYNEEKRLFGQLMGKEVRK